MSFYKHINTSNNNKWLYTLFFIFNITVNYSQDSIYKEFFFSSGQLSSKGYLINNIPGGKWVSYYTNSKIKSIGYWKDALLDSSWIFYDSIGKITLKENYKKNLKNGYSYQYDTNGLIIREILYLNGQREGKEVIYYEETKVIKKENNYTKNIKNGVSKEFDRNGNIILIKQYDMGVVNKKEEINRFDSDGKKDGVWKEYYASGKTKLEQTFFHGEKDGISKKYDKKGKLQDLESYDKGKRKSNNISLGIELTEIKLDDGLYAKGILVENIKNGLFKVYDSTNKEIYCNFYKNDTLVYKGRYDTLNKKTGKWLYYWPNGSVKKSGNYILNEKNKEWKYFFKNGLIQQKGNYVKNKPNGTWEWWYRSGQKRRVEDYENGKEKGFVFEYDTTGKVIVKGEYYYGLREGIWKYEINDYKEKGYYIGGMKTGKWRKTYITTNKDKFKGEYLNDIPIGKHVYYYSNGQIKMEGKYKNGERDGEWIYYNKLGDIIITYVYKDGREYKRDGVKVKY